MNVQWQRFSKERVGIQQVVVQNGARWQLSTPPQRKQLSGSKIVVAIHLTEFSFSVDFYGFYIIQNATISLQIQTGMLDERLREERDWWDLRRRPSCSK
jgi:hypothetical protein